jgi:hypothetical protein
VIQQFLSQLFVTYSILSRFLAVKLIFYSLLTVSSLAHVVLIFE